MNNQTHNPKRLLIMAGGTGGHVFPALAVAKRMLAEGFEVLWLGTPKGLEAQIVPKAEIPIRYITITGIRGKNLKTRMLAPFHLIIALYQAIKILHEFKPQVVLGMGGFVTGPGGVAAWLLRYPLVIHEQNAIAGITNRILSRLASRVLCGFPFSFPESTSAIWVGNPVREELNSQLRSSNNNISNLSNISNNISNQNTKPLHLLIIGGSQGASALNKLIPDMMHFIDSKHRPLIWHQTGTKDLASTRAAYCLTHTSTQLPRVDAFIEDMAEAYRWADLVVCRSGALTVAELANIGLASILIPFPFAVDDHQTHNGRFLAEAGAAKLFTQADLDPRKLADVIINFSNNPNALIAMGQAARNLAKPRALTEVIQQCIEVRK